MPRWLARWKRKPVVQVVTEVVTREANEFTVDQWRTLPEMVQRAKGVLRQPEFKQMVEALKNQHLSLFMADGYPDLNLRAVMQAQSEGYRMAINDLLALGVFKAPEQELQETFEPAEVPQSTEKE